MAGPGRADAVEAHGRVVLSAEAGSWATPDRKAAEREIFARVRAAFVPAGILNPGILPR
ncbi:hypothetical protein [Frankia sp. R43]|uniref:hypothetical protein n=1 Tax=Frankia sp. R43 TaxID=269536 RepID=UPI00137956C6|nr:hypothetical protein [Frankia sp. R43]